METEVEIGVVETELEMLELQLGSQTVSFV